MKKILFCFLMTILGISLFGCDKKPKDVYHAKINVEQYGTITLELYRKEAPITVDNFVKLAKKGKYDGTHFIRMQYGFCLQGGEGASDETIKGEFYDNGVNNTLTHKKGVISMARTTDMDSATSEFFILLETSTYLDGKYAAFGEVIDGWDVIDEIVDSVKDSWIDLSKGDMGFLKKDKYITISSIRIVD